MPVKHWALFMQKGNMDILKTLRIKKGMTQEDLSKKIGCHKQQIMNFESGQATMPLKYVGRASTALGIDKSSLLKMIMEEKENKWLEKYNNLPKGNKK